MKKLLMSFLSCSLLAATANAQESSSTAPATHTYEMTQTYDLAVPKGSKGETKLWIPLPFNNEYQQVKSIRYEGNYNRAYITENNTYGAKTLFADWDEKAQQRDLKLTLVIQTKDREPMRQKALENYTPPEKIIYSVDVVEYLKPTQHIKTDGIVKEYADKIVGQETNPLQKARLIHQWIVNNMERDNSVLGCGDGDVEKILTSGVLKGKCTDMNSVFVALARAAGIPAREVFGIRLGAAPKMSRYSKTAFGSADENRIAKISGAQHCRAEFYLAGFGWVPVDPADVAKMRLTEKKAVEDADVQAVSDYLFGNWEMNWVGFNHARDFELYPLPQLAPINNFGYPYAEIGGDPLNFFEPKEFKYDYSAKEL
ncbi:transglutaminase-like putative cysteine protease [Mesocricetibacter intestinalis]|uniref:Transglutaminase-like putative cysteine protease n=1 Tax=Mesocricetibacter intestinalis TaxID=1521930 RepID=A0A4V3DA09_9PAST|nr:transglutaminase family protein [Mesocricetibacter intestinalis]TDQ59633.1 transglutaminase-like putative cysteine protease [Mesocricetibacter intestinalis]